MFEEIDTSLNHLPNKERDLASLDQLKEHMGEESFNHVVECLQRDADEIGELAVINGHADALRQVYGVAGWPVAAMFRTYAFDLWMKWCKSQNVQVSEDGFVEFASAVQFKPEDVFGFYVMETADEDGDPVFSVVVEYEKCSYELEGSRTDDREQAESYKTMLISRIEDILHGLFRGTGAKKL